MKSTSKSRKGHSCCGTPQRKTCKRSQPASLRFRSAGNRLYLLLRRGAGRVGGKTERGEGQGWNGGGGGLGGEGDRETQRQKLEKEREIEREKETETD